MSLSRRDFLARSAGVIAATSFGQAAIARAMQSQQAQPAATPPPQQTPPVWTPSFTPIRRNVGFYLGRGGTIGYLIDKGAVVVVDSQYPDMRVIAVASPPSSAIENRCGCRSSRKWSK